MSFNTDAHHRQSLRLKGYDYAQSGAYFVTICTQDRACLFGNVVDDVLQLNDAGRMIQAIWEAIPQFYPGVGIDEFVAMPNHIHGIITLGGTAGQTRTSVRPQTGEQSRIPGQPRGVTPTDRGVRDGVGVGPRAYPCPPASPCPPATQYPAATDCPPTLSLADVVHRFKSLSTKRYTDGVTQRGWTAFRGRLWQRNYFEHIIRNEIGLCRVREYIFNNPRQWAFDQENPLHQSPSPHPDRMVLEQPKALSDIWDQQHTL